MKTECPHCHTIFRVNDQQLQLSGGQVRCGHCLAIFTAEQPQQLSFDDLLELDDDASEPVAAASVVNNDRAQKDSEASVAEEPETDAILTDEITAAETPAEIADTTSAGKPAVLPLPDVIPPALRAESRSGRKRFGFVSGFFWLLAIVLMIVVSLAQYAWYDRVQLLQYPQTRPWFELACQYLHCDLPEPRDVSQIELSRKNIYSHPNDKRGLMVSATMVNQAEFAQDYPVLELRFTNVRGEMIAARRFTPEEYLDLPKDSITKMQPGVAVAFTLEIIDPGTDVVSYEFTFL